MAGRGSIMMNRKKDRYTDNKREGQATESEIEKDRQKVREMQTESEKER